jgi:hypothetical protein
MEEPYHRASKAIREGEEYPLHVLKNAGLTAIGGGAGAIGAKVVGKIMPAIGALINQYVPENIAKAGLNKIDPRFGKFVQGAMDEGYTFDEVRDFLGDKVQKTQAQENKNIVERESPELHQFLDQEIKKGRKPIEAAALAQHDKRFSSIVQKLMKTHKTPWSQIIESIYGTGETAQQPQQQQMQQMQPQGQQPGQGQQALMAILQKINQKLNQ